MYFNIFKAARKEYSQIQIAKQIHMANTEQGIILLCRVSQRQDQTLHHPMQIFGVVVREMSVGVREQ